MSVGSCSMRLGQLVPTPGGGTAAAIAGAMASPLRDGDRAREITEQHRRGKSRAREGARGAAAADHQSHAARRCRQRMVQRRDGRVPLAESYRRRKSRALARHPGRTPRRHHRATRYAARLRGRTRAGPGRGSTRQSRRGERCGCAAVALLRAAAGAYANVQANLESIKDEGFKSSTDAEAARLSVGRQRRCHQPRCRRWLSGSRARHRSACGWTPLA